MEHPSILALGEAANDLVTWSNVCPFPPLFSHGIAADGVFLLQDIFSYNVEQSKGKWRFLLDPPGDSVLHSVLTLCIGLQAIHTT